MMPLEITPATVVLGLIIVVLALLAVKRLVKKGLCDCHADKDTSGGLSGCGCSGSCGGCSGCAHMKHEL
ncbi:hypothetical protein AALA21_02195 [Eggerthellaceae bacterium 3-80]|nr:hypothetical protein D7W09_00075 [bacterium D16-34]